eukprot:8604321-Pyramimonas_sp.AAC.2
MGKSTCRSRPVRVGVEGSSSASSSPLATPAPTTWAISAATSSSLAPSCGRSICLVCRRLTIAVSRHPTLYDSWSTASWPKNGAIGKAPVPPSSEGIK